jgi:carbamoylphosphate synthase large subunit
MNVAVTGVGGGVGQSVVRALRRTSFPVRIVGVDADPWGVGLYQCDSHVVIPPVSQREAYVEALAGVIRRHDLDALLPGTDTELLAIAEAKEAFLELGCRAIVSVPDFVRMSRDKLLSYSQLTQMGIPFVRTMSARDFMSSQGWFPAIVKPRGGSGSVGARVVHEMEDLRRAQVADEDVVQDYLVPEAWGVRAVSPQDVLKGGRLRQEDEVSVQAMVGPAGEIVAMFASINELRDGVPVRICPTMDEQVLEFSEKVFRMFAGMGHVGPVNIQGRKTEGGMVLYEVNPRFTGITVVRAALGWNECEAALRLFVLGESPESVAARLSYGTETFCLRYTTEEFVARSEVEGNL